MGSSMIRCKIEFYIRENELTLQGFAEKCGLNRGTLSAIINRNPPRNISVRELDRITQGMGLPEGELYFLYVEECLMQSAPHWRRVKPFLLRCAAIGKLNCIKIILEILADDLSNIQGVFVTAEQMFEQGHQEASGLLYQCVIECEKYNNSERLAISCYRLFQLNIGQDAGGNLRAALRFEPYRRGLPVQHRLDALIELIKIYFSVHNWEQLESLADELIEQSQAVYTERERSKRTSNPSRAEPIRLHKPLIRYFGQGYLCKATALQKMGRYEEAKEAINFYADLSWLEPANDEEVKQMLQFQEWATANSFTQDILMGHQEMLEPYVDFLQSHPEEILPGLVTIIQSANQYHFSIDWILDEFADSISVFDQFTDVVNMERRLRFAIQYSIYCVRRGRMKEGMESCLKALELSAVTNNETHFGDLIKEFMYARKAGLEGGESFLSSKL
ncbi:transcriptional regulator with XRE-family HTH domain [Paenibacillus forsythiae]|uniref:Transcriptional regulator with XRE-family HTH domain n=1 Tax=Paenibacillus forsythiae TaxID=365616 RepID=A0ABU3HC09_9BACL|nr:helix-turn-helix transcriptional regulator [Paenibacillus forsythiae]MDT3428354.1 transcriptional regulator with XRE-family HTH domain [Paenibacillus forsythiae]